MSDSPNHSERNKIPPTTHNNTSGQHFEE